MVGAISGALATVTLLGATAPTEALDYRGGLTATRTSNAAQARRVASILAKAVRPNAATTGVSRRQKLRVVRRDVVVTKPNQLLAGLDIRGYLVIKAPHVIIRNSIVRGPGRPPRGSRAMISATTSASAGVVIEDVTVAPRFRSPHIDGIHLRYGGIIRRVDVSGTVDGVKVLGGNVTIADSYLHNFTHFVHDPNWHGGPSHDDAVQIQGGANIWVQNSSLSGAQNSAVMVTQDLGSTRNLFLVGNWLSGGACTVNFGSKGAYKTGINVIANRFGRGQRVRNCAIAHNPRKSDLRPSANTWLDTGAPVVATLGQ